MTLLAGRARKTWLTAHVASSVAWLGGAYCMLVMATTAMLTGDPHLRLACYELMHLFDRAVHIPLAVLALVTGLVLSLRTRWGLFRHRWVTVKLVGTVAVMVAAPLLSVPGLLEAVDGLRAGRDIGGLPVRIVSVSVAVVAILTAITGISVFKPWGRRRRDAAGSPGWWTGGQARRSRVWA